MSDVDYAQIVREIERYKDLITEVKLQKRKIDSEINEVSKSLDYLNASESKNKMELLEELLKNDPKPNKFPLRSQTAPINATRANNKRVQSAKPLEEGIRDSIKSLPGKIINNKDLANF